MAKFLKLDMVDEDDLTISEIEAESLEGLLEAEIVAYKKDDRLEGCHGVTSEFSIGDSWKGIEVKTICWEPGDGGRYSIAAFGPDDESTREIFAEIME